MKQFFKLTAIAACTGLLLAACGSSETKESTSNQDTVAATPSSVSAQKNIVETAVSSPDHSTLVSAVQAAGLAETLSGPGPYTVFAPTNAAFSALPAGTLDNLLQPANKQQLAGILTYHVVSGKLMSSQLSDGQKVKTVNGQELTVSIKDGKVMINGANVTAADLEASNGVIHVIDAVVLPSN